MRIKDEGGRERGMIIRGKGVIERESESKSENKSELAVKKNTQKKQHQQRKNLCQQNGNMDEKKKKMSLLNSFHNGRRSGSLSTADRREGSEAVQFPVSLSSIRYSTRTSRPFPRRFSPTDNPWTLLSRSPRLGTALSALTMFPCLFLDFFSAVPTNEAPQAAKRSNQGPHRGQRLS